MTEQYETAAWRHLSTADKLLSTGDYDDAGYHFGMCAENSIKHALSAAGVSPYLYGLPYSQNPMRAHIPGIQQMLVNASALVATHASGRLSAPLVTLTSSAGITSLFAGWSINIRYADNDFCPVSETLSRQWKADAESLAWDLMI